MIIDIGVVAESEDAAVAENAKKWAFAGLREKEVHALIQAAILGESAPGMAVPTQIITGIGTGGMSILAGFEIPWWFEDSKFAHVRHVDTHQVSMDTEEDTAQVQTLLSQATS